MKKFWFMNVIFWACLIMGIHEGHAKQYRWIDAQGELHYSTQAPTSPVQSLEVKGPRGWQPYGQKIRPTSDRHIPQSVTKTTVNYVKKGNLIMLDVNFNNQVTARLAMDTGASYLVISPRLATQLGMSLQPTTPRVDIMTANGVINVPLVNVDVVKLGDIETPNVTAAVHKLEGKTVDEIDGLLGMSFLKRFSMSIDTPRRRMTLEASHAVERYAAMNCVNAMEWMSEGHLAGADLKKAAEYYEKAIGLCDDLYEAYYELADIYYVQKRYSRGVTLFKHAVERYPDIAETHYLLGVFYALDDKFLQARNEFRQTLQLDPEHKQAQERLEDMRGKVYQRREKK